MRTLDHDERHIADVRRHWFVFAAQLAVVLALASLPFVFGTLVRFGLGAVMDLPAAFLPYFGFFSSLWLIFVWMLAFHLWTDYYLDVWIVTDKRVIDFEYKGFFRYESSTLRLERIQDITVSVDGLLANIFGYGDLHVQTAGEASDTFIIRNAANPEAVKRLILQAYDQSKVKPAGL